MVGPKKKKKKKQGASRFDEGDRLLANFLGGKKSSNKKSLSGQRRYSTWAPYGGVKDLTRWQWADGWHVDAKRFGEKVRQIYGHIMLSHSCSQMWWKKMCEHMVEQPEACRTAKITFMAHTMYRCSWKCSKLYQTLGDFSVVFYSGQNKQQNNKTNIAAQFPLSSWFISGSNSGY